MHRFCQIAFALVFFCSYGARADEIVDGAAAYAKRDYTTAMRLLSASAAAGNADAEFFVGLMHWNGLGVPQNTAEGLRLIRAAAAQDHPRALSNLATIYIHGMNGTPVDKDEGVRLYRRAAELGYAEAMHNLAVVYIEGDGVAKNPAEAERWWTKAVELGHPAATINYATRLLEGRDVPRDQTRGIALLERLAASNQVAARSLATIYAAGMMGVSSNSEAGLKWFLQAAKLGDRYSGFAAATILFETHHIDESNQIVRALAQSDYPRAQDMLGQHYENGHGVPKDPAEAARWYRAAAEHGDLLGAFDLGRAYEFGIGVAPDLAAAAKWYRISADLGYANAQVNLGTFYAIGRGVQRNPAEAEKQFRRAAERGASMGMNNLAFLLDKGMGPNRNVAEALNWYEAAAEFGNPAAMHSLAGLYMKGDGVQANMDRSYYWSSLAVRFYPPGAQRDAVALMRDAAGTNLAAAARAAADQRIASFTPKPQPDLVPPPPIDMPGMEEMLRR